MLGVAFAITVATLAMGFIFALLVFASLVITALCICAWNEPLTLFGQTMTPQEAREFVARGLLGAIVVPAFVLFASVLFDLRIKPDFWLYLPLGGYALGSIVVGYHIEKAKAEAAEKDAATQALLPPQPALRVVSVNEVEIRGGVGAAIGQA
ncbi:hypothetical protein D8770_10735, partial [Methylobacterium sp. DB1607]|nr:hypothetical protein [Methylobacterium sp. DB1607]